MLTESTISIGRSTLDRVGASNQVASLSSSSNSTPTKAEKSEAEGTALAVGQTEEGVTVDISSLQTGGLETGTDVTNNNQPGNAGVRKAESNSANGRPTASSAEPLSPELAKQVEQEAEQRNKEKLDRISEEINDQLSDQLKLRFRTDEETGLDLFQLVEQETGEVVRQIPSEEVLSFMKRFQENSPGLLVSEQA